MADTVRIKRRASPGAVGAPASLANAELAYNENDHCLYIGEGTGGAGGSATTIVPVGGYGAFAPINSPAFTGTPTAPTVTPGTDSSTKLATTAFVQSAVSAVSSGVTNITVQDGLSGGGSGAVTIGINNNGIANGKLAQMPANTIKINNTGVPATAIDGTVAQTMALLGAAPLNSPTFTGTVTVPAPTNATDAASKSYVDSAAQGLDGKASVRSMTNANVASLSGVQSIDGVSNVAGDRVLLIGQTTQSQNGVYVQAAGAWARATDMDTWNELVSAYVWVEEGVSFADTGWLCTVNQGGTLGTTAVTWTQFSGAGQITAGAGLTKTGNTLDVVGTAARILVNADSIDIDSGYVGQTSITTLGTIGTGTWNGATIAVNRGGTGATTLTGYVKGSGTSPLTASATIPNTDITGLGTMATQNASAVAITGGTIDGITLDGGTF